MSKYLVLYRSEAALSGLSASEMFAKAPPEQIEAGMAMWKGWFEKVGSALVDPGAPLDKSTTVTAEATNQAPSSITGYSVIEASSMEEAKSLMKEHPHFFMPGASVEILEAVAIPGM